MLNRSLKKFNFDLQPESFDTYSSLSYQSNKAKTSNQENENTFHENDKFIKPQRNTHDRYIARSQSRENDHLFLNEEDFLKEN